MQEKTLERIGIGASIVGAVVGIAYLLRRPGGVTVVAGAPYSPTPGTTEQVGTQGIGIPGPQGTAGVPGQTGATGSAAGLQAASQSPARSGVPGANPGAGGVQSPSAQDLTAYFANQFYGYSGGTAYAPAMASNVPPGLDQSKTTTGNGNGSQNGCGCGSGAGGGGCNGGRCPNTPPGATYPDGAGACAASTAGRLVKTMERCRPGFLGNEATNMMGVVEYGTPDANLFFHVVRQRLAAIPSQIRGAKFSQAPNHVGPSRFGAA